MAHCHPRSSYRNHDGTAHLWPAARLQLVGALASLPTPGAQSADLQQTPPHATRIAAHRPGAAPARSPPMNAPKTKANPTLGLPSSASSPAASRMNSENRRSAPKHARRRRPAAGRPTRSAAGCSPSPAGGPTPRPKTPAPAPAPAVAPAAQPELLFMQPGVAAPSCPCSAIGPSQPGLLAATRRRSSSTFCSRPRTRRCCCCGSSAAVASNALLRVPIAVGHIDGHRLVLPCLMPLCPPDCVKGS